MASTATEAGAVRPPTKHRNGDSAGRYPAVDGLRAFGALAIVLNHWAIRQSGVVSDVGSVLNVGVTVFFVLSGFLLYRPFLLARQGVIERLSLRRYYARRFLRVVPAYWVAFAALVAFPGLALTQPLWVYLGFGQSYTPDALTGLPVAWSLSAEVAFYLLLPAVTFALGRTGRLEPLVLLAAIPVQLAGYLWLFHGGHDPGWIQHNAHWQYSILGTFDWFAIGLFLAQLSVRGDAVRLPRPQLFWWAAAGAFALMAASPDSEIVRHLGYGVFAACVVAPAVLRPSAVSRPLRLLQTPIATWLGLISYGIFLWHLPLLVWYDAHGVSGVPLALLSVATAITMGALSHYLVERTFQRLRPRRQAP